MTLANLNILGETERQVADAVEMEMRARRAEREAQVAREEAWREHIYYKEQNNVRVV